MTGLWNDWLILQGSIPLQVNLPLLNRTFIHPTWPLVLPATEIESFRPPFCTMIKTVYYGQLDTCPLQGTFACSTCQLYFVSCCMAVVEACSSSDLFFRLYERSWIL